MAYSALTTGETDADSPADTTLWTKVKDNFDNHENRIGTLETAIQESNIDWANAGGISQWTLIDRTLTGSSGVMINGMYKIYVPTNANSLEYLIEASEPGSGTSVVYLRTDTNDGGTFDPSSIQFSGALTLDVSDKSGWITIEVVITNNTGETITVEKVVVRFK